MTTTTEGAMKRHLVAVGRTHEDREGLSIWTRAKGWRHFDAADVERIREKCIRAAKAGTLRHESDRFGPSPRPAA
jgi:hypothetical protein